MLAVRLRVLTVRVPNNRVNSDSQKRRRYALPLSAAGYALRYTAIVA